jgi:hypothetical protein
MNASHVQLLQPGPQGAVRSDNRQYLMARIAQTRCQPLRRDFGSG